MTWRTRLTWIGVGAPAIATVVLAALLASQCSDRRDAEAELKKAQEAIALAKKGVKVAEQVPDVRPRVAELERENGALKAEIKRVKDAAPGAKPVGATTASTAPAPARGTPRPADPASQPGQPAPDAPACVLALGDLLQLRMTSVDLLTKAGNHVIVGTQEAWRMSPGAPTLLLQQPWAETRAVMRREFAAAQLGWGAGPLVLGTREGWSAGVLVAFPPTEFLGLQIEPLAGGAVGLDGKSWAAQAAALFRRSPSP